MWQIGSYVGLKVGSKIMSEVRSKYGTNNSVLAFLKCMDRSVLAFLKCMDGSILVSLKCMDGSVLAHLRFSIQSTSTRYPQPGRKAPKCPIWKRMSLLGFFEHFKKLRYLTNAIGLFIFILLGYFWASCSKWSAVVGRRRCQSRNGREPNFNMPRKVCQLYFSLNNCSHNCSGNRL